MTARAAGSAVVEALRERAGAAAEPDAEQLALIDDLPPGLDPQNVLHQGAIERLPRGRGRPAGSTNRATRDMKKLVALLGDPLLEMAKWARHTPESLARVIGCTKAEAFDRLMSLHRELAPFLHARLAQVDDAGNPVVPQFHISAPGGQVAVVGGLMPWETEASGYSAEELAAIRALRESQQNQALPASPAPVSHGAVSHEDGK